MPFGPLLSPEALFAERSSFLLVDARPQCPSPRLEGALALDLNADLSTAEEAGFDPAKGGRHPLPTPSQWSERLGRWGIGPEHPIVVYDAASGANAACRLWWMLRAAGHEAVAVLDGGLQAAQAIGMKTSPEMTPPLKARPPYPMERWQLPTVDIETVDRLRQDPASRVLDVRSSERWRGEVEPFDPVPGRIPGSVNIPYSENLDPEGRFKAPWELRELYLALPPERLVVHCGSGVTACHTLLALELAGLSGAALYVGSYSEWCRSTRPLGRG